MAVDDSPEATPSIQELYASLWDTEGDMEGVYDEKFMWLTTNTSNSSPSPSPTSDSTFDGFSGTYTGDYQFTGTNGALSLTSSVVTWTGAVTFASDITSIALDSNSAWTFASGSTLTLLPSSALTISGAGSLITQSGSALNVGGNVNTLMNVLMTHAGTGTIADNTDLTFGRKLTMNSPGTFDLAGSNARMILETAQSEGTTVIGSGSTVGSSGQGTMQVTKGLLQNLGTFSCPLSMVTPSYPLTRGLDYSNLSVTTACGSTLNEVTLSSGTALVVQQSCNSSQSLSRRSGTAYSVITTGNVTVQSGGQLIFDTFDPVTYSYYGLGTAQYVSFESGSYLQVVSASASTFSNKVLVRSSPNSSCSTGFTSNITNCPSGLTCSITTGSSSSECLIYYNQQTTSSDDSDESLWWLMLLLLIPFLCCCLAALAMMKKKKGNKGPKEPVQSFSTKEDPEVPMQYPVVDTYDAATRDAPLNTMSYPETTAEPGVYPTPNATPNVTPVGDYTGYPTAGFNN
jgi:hypothetical protein